MEKYKQIKQVRQRIEKNYNFIKKLEYDVNKQLTDIKKLEYISLVANLYSEYVTGIYSNMELEKNIIEIGRRNIEFLPEHIPQKRQFLHVMTKAAWVGGHTVLVNNWVKWDDDNSYSLVLTDMEYMDIPDFLLKTIYESGGTVYCLQGDFFDKAKELLNISQKFERIILNIHMDDVVPVLAYSNENWNIPVYFYNHADFRFSLGFSVADVVMNLNPYDKKKTEVYRGIVDVPNIVVRFPNMGKIDEIPIYNKKEIRDHLVSKYNINVEKKVIVSMGADFKYEDVIGYKFDDFCQKLISKCGDRASIYIIGADPTKKKWIDLQRKTNGKVKALGILPRTDADGLIQVADLFILSFPMISSGAMVAERAKVPYLALHIISRGKELYGRNSCTTVEELIQKSLHTLFVDSEAYLRDSKKYEIDKNGWKKVWHDICYDNTEHKIRYFHEHRLVKKQEYINCQLMQDNANSNFSRLLMSRDICFKDLKKIYSLSLFYNVDILNGKSLAEYAFENLIEKNRLSKKHLHLYLVAVRLLKNKRAGINVSESLSQKGYMNVAIYGMSYLGELLVYELKESDVNVRCGIDKNAINIHSSIDVYLPSEFNEDVDVVINSAVISNEVVKMEIKNDKVKIISLESLVF